MDFREARNISDSEGYVIDVYTGLLRVTNKLFMTSGEVHYRSVHIGFDFVYSTYIGFICSFTGNEVRLRVSMICAEYEGKVLCIRFINKIV